MATIDEVVKAYYLHRSQGMMIPLNNLHKRYSKMSKITQPMAKAILEGAHQERMIYATNYHYAKLFYEVCKRLKGSALLTDSFSTFEDLYDEVYALLIKHSKIHGVGNLTVYDIALRIGYIRKEQILPKNQIYLFAGAFKGANNLLHSSPSLFNVSTIKKEDVYDMSIFNSPLSNMPSMFLEDLLCVYDSKLDKYTALNYSVFQNVPNYYISYN